MSDTEKDRPESPKDVEPEAKPSGGAVVISIEQARAELLAKPRQRATPQMGVMRSRPRAREVPAPVTMPPGEHTAFIVTDTPAARAHVDKKTVHPGEMPVQTHDKKVRVKTSLDPRRAKTQMSDRRGAPEPPGPAADEGEPASLWHHPKSQPPPPAPPAASPASVPPRLSLARPRPIPREKAGVPLFVIGVIIAASVGAAVVYLLGRTGAPATAPPTATVAATSPPAAPPASSPAATAQGGATAAAAAPSTSATAAEAPSTSAAVPAAASSAPSAVKSTSPTVKPSTAPTLAPTATAKPTATSVLPFGVGHD